jgi:hypothetical protein
MRRVSWVIEGEPSPLGVPHRSCLDTNPAVNIRNLINNLVTSNVTNIKTGILKSRPRQFVRKNICPVKMPGRWQAFSTGTMSFYIYAMDIG